MRSRAKQGNVRTKEKLKDKDDKVVGYRGVQRPAFGSLRGNKRRMMRDISFRQMRKDFAAQELRRQQIEREWAQLRAEFSSPATTPQDTSA